MGDLVVAFNLPANSLGHLTSAVQLGFISGTLVFAFFMISDRFHPSRLFFVCALLGAFFNLLITWDSNTLTTLLFFRFLTGFFLAGIYPVGMKIAADFFANTLGKSLGLLVGALVLGTALPHFLKYAATSFPWQYVLYATTLLATFGGILLVLLVPEGPHRSRGQKLDLTAFVKVFRAPSFRAAAFGYFGHMWELYAFWAFIPVMLALYKSIHDVTFSVSLWSFIIIGVGSLGCWIGSLLGARFGNKRIAVIALGISGSCCLFSPLIITGASTPVFLGFLIIWGMAVITDSPMFSTLVAQNCHPSVKGTALTIVNGIGFSITIISIELLSKAEQLISPSNIYLLLAIGPAFGLAYLFYADQKSDR